MDRKGFISISVVYTLFIVLLMLLLSILAGYVNKRLLLKVNKGDISDILVDSEDNRNIATVCRGQYLGNCFSQNSNLDKDLYHHDGKVDYIGQVNANLEAMDESYRYAGANPHNFVCIDNKEKGDCNENNLFRIIGFFALDNETYAAKLIKNTAIGQREWNGDTSVSNLNGWWDSELRTYLNDLNSSPLKGIFSYIHEDDWYVDRQNSDNMVKKQPQNVYKYEKYIMEVTGNPKMIVNSKIGLMYISDYMYAASPEAWTYVGDNYGISATDYSSAKSMNWLAGIDEYVLTSASNSNNQAFYLQASGKVGVCNVNVSHYVRPVFSLLPNVIVKSGIGIKSEPYRIAIGKSDMDASIDTTQISSFSYIGDSQTFTAPVDGEYKIELWGASGDNTGIIKADTFGRGAYTTGQIFLNAGNKLYVYVGGWPYNGGGPGEAMGGGATDVRLTPGNWDSFDSLKSRIMVAAGGGGGIFNFIPVGNQRGDGGALNGFDATYYVNFSGHGATQTSGGKPGASFYAEIDPSRAEQIGSFGRGGYGIHAINGGYPSSGGGGGYYGGGHGNHTGNGWTGGGGGSSFISGYAGCNAIANSSTAGNIVHTNNSVHYSGTVFKNMQMIAGNANMPSPSGGTEVGHTGTGYAKITLMSVASVK